MNFEFKSSFDRSVKSLSPQEKKEVKELCICLIDILSGEGEISPGLGLKRLRKCYWEIRKGIKHRILFKWEGDSIEFILAGGHDAIKKQLKS